ncbi:DUF5813 family protein [Halovivax sp.]|uniref:DUF5813 family protein n=1 Tax=Halovivax sp. TaxID=1935978 RepID=UPI0025C17DB9|nr:DUF5813 family protein [Halovivax sp.]
MTDDSSLPEAVERALADHEAFEPADEGYALTTTVFDARVDAEPADGERDGEFAVTVRLPSLDAAVAGETVAAVVEDDWADTFERRLADVFSVARTGTHEEPAVERAPSELRVVLEYTAWDAEEGVADAKTLIEYVEGTYAQGLIPGYDYRGEAATLLETAQSRGQEAADGDGTPL